VGGIPRPTVITVALAVVGVGSTLNFVKLFVKLSIAGRVIPTGLMFLGTDRVMYRLELEEEQRNSDVIPASVEHGAPIPHTPHG